MAAKKGTNAKKTSAKKQPQKKTSQRKPLTALLMFVVSLFILAVTFIPGENLWQSLRDFFFGLFGVLAYIFPFYLIALSIFYAMDKLKGSVIARFVEIALVVLLVEACIDIFAISRPVSEYTLGNHLSAAYTSGMVLHSGGFFGGLLAQPLYAAFGKTGALITIFLLIFVLVMVITGTTMVTLIRKMQSSAKTVKDSYKEYRDNREERRRKEEIDIPLDDPATTDPTKGMNEKQKKVISTYKDIELPEETEEEIPEFEVEDDEELESVTVEEALQAASEEAFEEDADIEEEEFEAEEAPKTIVMQKEDYLFPPMDLLKNSVSKSPAAERAELEGTAQRLVDTLRSFGVETSILDISRGPTVTRYELQPSSGVKISKITNLADDIALNLATAGVRIEAPIPNKAAVGIEVPNKSSNVVHIREILESSAFTGSKSKLTISLGKDIAGNAIVGDISKMPHGLIAGATGSGKSVCINSIIVSILYKAKPDEVKLIMVDPKVVELGIYNGIPHLLVPVVTDPRKASGALGWAVSEMEKRYRMFADRGVRDIAGYNRFVDTLEENTEVEKMPHIVIIVDELADLMMTASHEVEDSINRIAAKARAAGMHLIIATQRPSVDVVTGVIKANIPTRIAFAVSSQIDSRTILDSAGAEKLIGRGDMLFAPIGSSKPNRIQGCFVSDEEVEKVVDFIKSDHTAEYDDNIMVEIERQAAVEKKQKTGLPEDGPDEDPMLTEAIKVVVENGMASTSLLQRKLKLGYARAARIVDEMEQRGVVGPYEGSKPRKVLITPEQLMEMEAQGED